MRKQLCGMFERCGRSWSLAAQGPICFHTATGSTDTFGVGSIVDSMARNSSKEEKEVMVNGVARAFFEAPISRELAVQLPVEDGGGPGSEMVGLLQKSFHGAVDAAANFQREVKSS